MYQLKSNLSLAWPPLALGGVQVCTRMPPVPYSIEGQVQRLGHRELRRGSVTKTSWLTGPRSTRGVQVSDCTPKTARVDEDARI